MNPKNKKALVTAGIVLVVAWVVIAAVVFMTHSLVPIVIAGQLPLTLAFAVVFWRVTRIWKETDNR